MNPLVYLAHFPKITFRRYVMLREGFLNLDDFLQWEITDLLRCGFDEPLSGEYVSWRENNPPQKLEETLMRHGIDTTALTDNDYPELLKEIADPPIALFYRGKLPDNKSPSLAVVGTRRNTFYGEQATKKITSALAQENITIVSGLAFGIDATAHNIALEHKCITVAVLGTSCEETAVSPRPHQSLARKIIENDGAIISEYPPGTQVTKRNFPARNRIVAGMTPGTLVTEAPIESGALITARLALDYNREVFAVPHPINSDRGTGCNQLIKLGAHLTTEAKDILDALNITGTTRAITQTSLPLMSANENKIYKLLLSETKDINQIIRECGLPSAEINGILTMMELKGLIKGLGGMVYGRI